MIRSGIGVVALLAGCSQEPRIEGVVMDIWDNPVEGATVVVEGETERPLTDRAGRFSLPYVPGKQHMKAGREGYIQEHADLTFPEDPSSPDAPKPLFRLYPKPEEAGFYIIGTDAYTRLDPQPVTLVGDTDLQTYRGMRFVGDGRAEGTQLKVLFHTPLKMDKVMRLDLRLHRMQYVQSAKMTSVVGDVPVDINLWTPADDVDLTVEPLRSRTDYLLTSADALPAGTYAIDAQGLLKGSSDAEFHEVPEPWRIAYPIEMR